MDRDTISFKTRKHPPTAIEIKKVKNIEIELDTIKIFATNKEYFLDIEDYTKYEDRMRIKNNFEIVKENLFEVSDN